MTYATAGAGHRRAAEALAQAIQARYPHADVECVDILAYTPAWFRQGYPASYLLLVRHFSWAWRLGYALLDARVCAWCLQRVRRHWNALMARRFIRWLIARPPDVIVTTHFFPTEVCSTGKRAGWLTSKLIVVVTDLYPHAFWVAPEPEAFAVGTHHGAAMLERRGVPRERIHATGIPIAQAFGGTRDAAALRTRLGVSPDRLTILVTSGGTTVGHFESVVRALLALEQVRPGKLQLLVVCGDDERMRQRLVDATRESPMPIRIFGFVDYMADLMAVSDLVVAKAGGLTVSEALGSGVPLVFYHIIPGQEWLNARYAVEHGAATIALRSNEVAQSVTRCLDDPARLAAMRAAARALSHADATERIVSSIVRPLLEKGDVPIFPERR